MNNDNIKDYLNFSLELIIEVYLDFEKKRQIPFLNENNRNLTILEAVIIYLKHQGIKYSEMSKIINRDQRNIWTIYSRAEKKMNC